MNAARRTCTAKRYAPQRGNGARQGLIGTTGLMPSVAHQSYQRGGGGVVGGVALCRRSFEHTQKFDLPPLLVAGRRPRSSVHASPRLVRIVESPETSVPPPQKTKIMLAACDDIFFLMWM